MEKQKSTQSIKPFLDRDGTLIDVRSPSEFLQGHIPGAINIPLFSDEERATIGTLYKKNGENAAIALGLQYVTPKIDSLSQQVKPLLNPKIYCWRGGLRSQSVTQFLNAASMQSISLRGGYKSYRRAIEKLFSNPWKMTLLGGLTGCGKTEKLETLKETGEQTINLEDLANHRGSSFGHLGKGDQPTTEHFQNLIGIELIKMNPDQTLWIEDESRLLGACHLPETFYTQMRNAPVEMITCSLEERLARLNRDYGFSTPQDFILAVRKIKNKLGSKRTEDVIKKIHTGKLKEAATLVLMYYDKTYQHSLQKRLPTLLRGLQE